MEMEVPVVKMRRPRVKKPPAAEPVAEPVAAPAAEPVASPPEPVLPPAPEPVVVATKPPRKPHAQKKKDEQQQLSLTDAPAGSSDDLQAAPPAPVERTTEAAPEGGEPAGDVRPFTEVVKKKRGPYKPRQPKEAAPAAPPTVEVDQKLWMGLDTTIKNMRRQARQERFANFVIA